MPIGTLLLPHCATLTTVPVGVVAASMGGIGVEELADLLRHGGANDFGAAVRERRA